MEEEERLELKIEIKNIEQQINNLNLDDLNYEEKRKILIIKAFMLIEKYNKYSSSLYYWNENGDFTLPREKYYKNDELLTLLHDPFTE